MLILIADDEAVSRTTLAMFCRKIGYDTLLAADGRTAYELWLEHRPRILITDWNMPEMDGPTLSSKIRADAGDEYTYIIMVTSREESGDLIEGFHAGIDDYLTKPVNRAELEVRLRSGERILTLQDKDTVIFSLAKLAETRDPETGLHLERIQSYCRVIAEKLMHHRLYPDMINRRFVEEIFATSPLHDIGKVGIPDQILLKPGRLDEQEFEIMKTHTLIGCNTLQSSIAKNPRANYLKMSAQIARSHHERWDGKGYPDGLIGDDIPLAARIVSVADVYDALASKRIYKEAFSHEKTRSMISEGKSGQFDPLLVDVFLECEQEFAGILQKFKEE